MFLKKGERGLLVGKTGSGKSQNGYFHCVNACVWPVIIFDTKIEDAFFSLPQDDEDLDLIEGSDAFESYAKKAKKDMADFILVRPTAEEFQSPELMDKYLEVAYHKFGACYIFIDEVKNFHKGINPVPNLLNLLTRGRSKGKTTMMGNQRPAGISRSCLTETDRFYMHQLTDNRDRKTLGEVVPDFESYAKPPQYHFWHYSHADHETCELFSPVPETKIDRKKVFSRKWI